MKKLLIIFSFALAAAAADGAVDRFVAAGAGVGSAPYTDWSTASGDIKTVVDYANAADAGDTVWISNGTYVLAAQIIVSNTMVRGFGTNNAAVIVDGDGTYTCFKLVHGSAVLDGLTITNGQADVAAGYIGGGVYMEYGSMLNCRLLNNMALTNDGYNEWRGGGGAYMKNEGCLISNCVFIANRAIIEGLPDYRQASGGGIYMQNGTVVDCEFYNNDSYRGSGGGVFMLSGLVTNCTFGGNEAYRFGGGIAVYTGIVANCTIISNNCAGVLSSYYSGGGIYLGLSSALLVNSFVLSNESNHGAGLAMDFGASASNCVIAGNFAIVQQSRGPESRSARTPRWSTAWWQTTGPPIS